MTFSTTIRKPIDFTLDSSRRDQVTVVWEGLTMLDAIGRAYELPAWEYKCVQMVDMDVTNGDGRTVMEGSIDGINWAILHDRWNNENAGLDLANPIRDLAETPRYVRPRMNEGNENAKHTIKLFCRRSA